jgi:hypothetical protein
VSAESKSEWRFHILMAVITAALAFFGAVGGTVITQQFELTKLNREAALAYNREILQRRGQLIEDTIRLANKGTAGSIHSLALEHSKVAAAASKDKAAALPELAKGYDELLKMNELKAEYGTLISMDAMFFGPKTRAAIVAIDAKPGVWWERKSDDWQPLFDAMYKEWTYGLEGVTTIGEAMAR